MHNHETLTEPMFAHILDHSLGDTLHLIPFLFIVFVVLEYIEHSMNNRTLHTIEKAGKAGPLIGSVIGAFPQCGFSLMATNLFAGRVITLGTLVAVYLSTSDEMLPVMLAGNADLGHIAKIIVIKILIALVAGFAVDFVFNLYSNYRHKHGRQHHEQEYHEHHISEFCEEEGCHCGEEHPVVSALKHTVKIFIVIFAVTFLLNLVIEFAGLEIIEQTMSKAGIWAPIVSCVVGLIPNCASSVAITQLYLNGAITLGTAMSGLLCGSGIGWIVLFRVNPHSRENFKIMGIIFTVAALCGIVMNMYGVAL